MKNIYTVSVAALILMACSAENSTTDAELTMADDAQFADESMSGRSIDGRWGIQYEACSPANETGDGVILVSRYDVIIGMDACSITGSSEEGGVYAIQAMCDGAEGDQYEATFHFSTPQDGVMRWDNREFNRTEDYISCDGGAMH